MFILILATVNQSFLCVRRKVKFDQGIGEKTETFSQGKLKSTPAAKNDLNEGNV